MSGSSIQGQQARVSLMQDKASNIRSDVKALKSQNQSAPTVDVRPEILLIVFFVGLFNDKVCDILHGRVWAGHNIVRFDCVRIREAFAGIGCPAPEPKGTIDTLTLLTERFGRRAGNMKMATLANIFWTWTTNPQELGRRSNES